MTGKPIPTPAEPFEGRQHSDPDRADRFVIPLLLVSAFVVILNETIMGVALPELNRDLGISVSTGQWLTSAFMLVMAVVIPVTGYLLQRFHVRQVFITAMALFSFGTLLCFLASGFPALLAGRIVQAGGTAIMMPLLMTTVLNLVPADRRGRTMGNISIVISVAPAIGPTLSGLILDVLDWRWLFGLVRPSPSGDWCWAHCSSATSPNRVPPGSTYLPSWCRHVPSVGSSTVSPVWAKRPRPPP